MAQSHLSKSQHSFFLSDDLRAFQSKSTLSILLRQILLTYRSWVLRSVHKYSSITVLLPAFRWLHPSLFPKDHFFSGSESLRNLKATSRRPTWRANLSHLTFLGGYPFSPSIFIRSVCSLFFLYTHHKGISLNGFSSNTSYLY
jgi:hypothetical protein